MQGRGITAAIRPMPRSVTALESGHVMMITIASARSTATPAKERGQPLLTPGQKGTKKLLRQYGSQLVCVRYRYDAERRLRFKTVELIIEQAPWSPTPMRIADTTLVGVRVGAKEVALQRQVKQAGGRWNPAERVWEMSYSRAMALGLNDRIEKLRISNSRNLKMSNRGNQ
jgi:hypothetical protein